MPDTTTEVRQFALGDRITYADGLPDRATEHTGIVRAIFTPDNDDSGHHSYWVADETYPYRARIALARGDAYTSARSVWDAEPDNDAQGHWVSTRYDRPRPADPEPEPEPSAEALQVAALEATVSDLRSQVAEATRVLSLIGSALQETADKSEWCGEYDRRLAELADSLPGRYGFTDTFREAAEREREYEVCVHWTETVEHSTTVTVEASSESAAVDMVTDDPSAYVESDDSYTVNERSVEWDEIHVD